MDIISMDSNSIYISGNTNSITNITTVVLVTSPLLNNHQNNLYIVELFLYTEDSFT